MQSYSTSESEGVAEICLVVNFPIQVPLSIEVTIHQDEMSESWTFSWIYIRAYMYMFNMYEVWSSMSGLIFHWIHYEAQQHSCGFYSEG